MKVFILKLLRYVCVVLLLFAIISTQTNHVFSQHEDMKVHYIYVGQGARIVNYTSRGKSNFIDAGHSKQGKPILSYLNKRNIKSLDLVIATLPDIDHIGGLITVLHKIKVHKIIDSGKIYDTHT